MIPNFPQTQRKGQKIGSSKKELPKRTNSNRSLIKFHKQNDWRRANREHRVRNYKNQEKFILVLCAPDWHTRASQKSQHNAKYLTSLQIDSFNPSNCKMQPVHTWCSASFQKKTKSEAPEFWMEMKWRGKACGHTQWKDPCLKQILPHILLSINLCLHIFLCENKISLGTVCACFKDPGEAGWGKMGGWVRAFLALPPHLGVCTPAPKAPEEKNCQVYRDFLDLTPVL